MVFQLRPNNRALHYLKDTTGFSRVVFQLRPNTKRLPEGYQRLQPHGGSVSPSRFLLRRIRPKLKLHAAEAGGIYNDLSDPVRLKLKNHAAEAGGIIQLPPKNRLT